MENTTVEDITHRALGLMTQMQYANMLEYCFVLLIVLSLMGIVSNIINIRVFIAMGLNDGATVSFLALAIFDLVYLITSLPLSITTAFYVCELKMKSQFNVDPFAIFVFGCTIMIMINITNALTTTFLAVVRCLCVAKPLQFKNTITKKRATLFLAGIAIFAGTIYIPILANMGMINKIDTLSNTSRPSLWISPKRDIAKNIVWMVTEMFLPITTQLVILVCIIIMVRCLRAASKFRHSSTGGTAPDDKDNNKHACRQSDTVVVGDSNSSSDKLTGKDLRVVQQVVLISVVYIVCNVPKLLISICSVIEPEFAVSKRYTNIYISMNFLRKHFEVINATVNVIIYYKYNTKFRTMLRM